MSKLCQIYDVKTKRMLFTFNGIGGSTNFMSWDRLSEILQEHESIDSDQLTHIEITDRGLNLVFG